MSGWANLQQLGQQCPGDGSFVPSLDRSHSSGIRMLCGCLGTCCSWTHTCLAKNVYWESLGGHFIQTAGNRLAWCTSALPCSQISARNDKAQPKYIPLTSFQAIFKVFEILQFYWYHLNAMKFSRKKGHSAWKALGFNTTRYFHSASVTGSTRSARSYRSPPIPC